MRLTFVESERDNSTAWKAEWDWPELAHHLTTHRRLPAKGELAVIFARFVDGPCRRRARLGTCTKHCPGSDHRIDENVISVTALGLDFDSAPAARLGALMQSLNARGLRWLGYTTWSSTPEHPKIRIVIALDAEVPAAQYRGFWDAVIDELGISDIVDKSCRNPGRLFFTPQCPPDATPSAMSYEGIPLATAPILARVTPDAPRVSVEPHDPVPGALTLDRALAEWQPNARIESNGPDRYADVECPWADEHTDGRRDARVFEVGGLLGFKCLHSHCAGRDWHAFRQFYDPSHVPAVPRIEDHVDVFGDAPAFPSILVGEIATTKQPPVRRYPSGLPELDSAIGGGFSTRQLLVIMAPPGDGKSALAITTSLHMQRTLPVLYASTELEGHELMARVAAQILEVPWRDIVDGKIDQAKVASVLASMRVHLLGCERLPMGDAALQTINDEIARIGTLYGVPPLGIVDYLQDLARGVDERGVRGKIGSLGMHFRAMSQRLDCPLMVISSVSRTYYGIKRAQELREVDDATVYLAAAKESGDVDYAAATVLFLDVAAREPDAQFRCARIAIAKARHGTPGGFVGARFYGATGRWIAAPDEVQQVSRRRNERAEADLLEQLDSRMLAAINQRATEGKFYTLRQWRTDFKPEGMSQHQVNDTCDRLTRPDGPLTTQRMHPVELRNAPGGGEYIILRSMLPQRAP